MFGKHEKSCEIESTRKNEKEVEQQIWPVIISINILYAHKNDYNKDCGMVNQILKITSRLSKATTLSNYKAGDVVEVDLNPTIGDEKNKMRPCLIIEGGLTLLELVIVLPITGAKQKNSPIFVPIIDLKLAGLKKPSAIDTYQIRAIFTKRVLQKLGTVSKQEMFKVRFNLARILSIDEAHL